MTKKEISTKRLIERLEQDSKKEDAMELVRRAAQGDIKAAEFVLNSVDGSRKKNSRQTANS